MAIVVLSPFIVTNNLLPYLKNQLLASTHTMLSAQQPNIPMIFSVILNCIKRGLTLGVSENPYIYNIEPQSLRRIIYLSIALILILSILSTSWVLARIDSETAPFEVASAAVLLYGILNSGVHENHISMAAPLLLMVRGDIFRTIKLAFYIVFPVNLILLYGFGRTITPNWGRLSGAPLTVVSLFFALTYVGSFGHTVLRLLRHGQNHPHG